MLGTVGRVQPAVLVDPLSSGQVHCPLPFALFKYWRHNDGRAEHELVADAVRLQVLGKFVPERADDWPAALLQTLPGQLDDQRRVLRVQVDVLFHNLLRFLAKAPRSWLLTDAHHRHEGGRLEEANVQLLVH